MRGTTSATFVGTLFTTQFQSTSLLRGTTLPRPDSRSDTGISIHVPLARDDSGYGGRRSCSGYFNPRPSCEGRLMLGEIAGSEDEFQSTSLLRGTTRFPRERHNKRLISIHVPLARDDREEREAMTWEQIFQSTSLLRGTTRAKQLCSRMGKFQSTSLLRGTTCCCCRNSHYIKFQSTSLLRGTTRSGHGHGWHGRISIHVPLARDDARCNRYIT